MRSALGVPLRTRSMADSVLAAFRAQAATGVTLQAAVEANRIDRHLAYCLAEQEDRAAQSCATVYCIHVVLDFA